MKFMLLILIFLSTFQLFGSDKSTVTLSEKGYSSSGGGDRSAEIEIKLSNGWNNGPMSSEDKVKALKKSIAFYQLMVSKKVDLSKSITAAYAEKAISEVFKELIPNVPIEYKGVKPEETVETMAITKASLEKVLNYLDEAAGVYFIYSEKGILVSSEPE
ncbi:MAG: hypothetical protein ACJAR1_001094 [Rubritalea sp.]|jgi:hypothetical protein